MLEASDDGVVEQTAGNAGERSQGGSRWTTSAQSTGGIAAGGFRQSVVGSAAGGASGGTRSNAGTVSGGIGGMIGVGGESSATSVGDPHWDPEGDVSLGTIDLLEAHVYYDGASLVAEIRFADEPLANRGWIDVGVMTLAEDRARYAGLFVENDAGEFRVRWLNEESSLSFDSCTAVAINADTGWLVVRLPVVTMPAGIASSFSIHADSSDASRGDELKSSAIPLEIGPAPDRAATPICGSWQSTRKSTVRFREVSLGQTFGCGLDLAGNALCWGTAVAMAALGTAPVGPFKQIAVSDEGYDHRIYACGLRFSGALQCWGQDPPERAITYLRIGEPFGCGEVDPNNVYCIGETLFTSSDETLVAFSGNASALCVLAESGTIRCMESIAVPAGSDYVAVELASEVEACGLHRDGKLECGQWHAPPLVLSQMDGPSPIPDRRLNLGCGLSPLGRVQCWGQGGLVAPSIPGVFKRIEVSVTGEGLCALRFDDTLECWHYDIGGGDHVPETSPP
ncbi:MAG: hypothetical protein QM784_39190 [Polyangiaceae bacterium]